MAARWPFSVRRHARRGAWKINSVSNTIRSDPVLRIDGTSNPDAISLARHPKNPLLLDAQLNGALSTFQLSVIKRIEVNGLGGSDIIAIDHSNGPVAIARGIVLNGGSGTDKLLLFGGEAIQNRYCGSLLNSAGAGIADLLCPTVASSQSRSEISFADASVMVATLNSMEAITDDVVSPELIVTATNGRNHLTLEDGISTPDHLRVQVTNDSVGVAYAPIEFSNKSLLALNGDAAAVVFGQDDSISITNTHTALGLQEVVVNGRVGDDTFVVGRVLVPTTVFGSFDDDFISVGESVVRCVVGGGCLSGHTLASIDAPLTVDGGLGSDRLDILDLRRCAHWRACQSIRHRAGDQ